MEAWEAHLAIGMAALEEGMIDLRAFREAMEVIAGGSPPTVEELWVKSGRLSGDQVERLTAIRSVQSALPSTATSEHEEPRPSRPSVPPAGPPMRPPEPTRMTGTPMPARGISDPGTRTFHERTGARATEVIIPAGSRDRNFEFPPLERYTVVGVLGSGGMGDVVECIDQSLSRRVALKSVRPRFDRDSEQARMLVREARLTGSLEHPNIIPVYDFGESPSLGPYYIMRRLEQSTLANALERLIKGEPSAVETYTLGRLLRWFIQVCEAVDYAHSRRVLHRDLKPANILLGAFGEVLLADWGFACRLDEGIQYRGGTVGYSAPEQFELVPKGLDVRVDVFALGAILYEILTLKSAFPDAPESATKPAVLFGWQGYHTPKPPQQVAGTREVPGELAEICMKALSLDREGRYASVREMALAIEAFLDRTKELERRRKRAAELADEAEVFADEFYEYVETRPTNLAELVERRNATLADSRPLKRRELWDAEDRLLVTDALAIRTLHAAVSSYEQALDEVPGHPRARQGLARLYWAEMQRAEERRDDFDRIYAEELVRRYDDGSIGDELGRGGFVSLAVSGGDEVACLLETLGKQERKLVPLRTEILGPAPLRRARVPRGSHVVILRRRDQRDVRCPVFVRGGQEVSIHVDLDDASALDAGEVFVPGGPALFADEETFGSWGSLRRIDVSSFAIAREPVTFREYLEFLKHVATEHPSSLDAHMPRSAEDTPYFRWDGTRFGVHRIPELSDDVSEQAIAALPVFGVSALSADAFAAFRSSGSRIYRLPTEHEWEKAARGVDGRRYPWGDHFDPSFCHMRDSRPGLPRPGPTGVYEADLSVYGVRDMAGCIAEWVAVPGLEGDPRGIVSRGGAWCDPASDCALSARRRHLEIERSSRIGFRLARSVR